jgi:hypothetical protein
MKGFNVGRVGNRRSGAVAFWAVLFVGVAVGAYLGFRPFRALAARAGERAHGVGGDLIDRARNGAARATNGQAFVTLSPDPEPAVPGGTGGPEPPA